MARLFFLTPSDPSDPAWRRSRYKAGCIVYAGSEWEGRELAADAFTFNDAREKSPWLDADLAECSEAECLRHSPPPGYRHVIYQESLVTRDA